MAATVFRCSLRRALHLSRPAFIAPPASLAPSPNSLPHGFRYLCATSRGKKPAVDPTAQKPPAVDPTAQKPPAGDPTAQNPPAVDPTAQKPPAVGPMAQKLGEGWQLLQKFRGPFEITLCLYIQYIWVWKPYIKPWWERISDSN